MKYRPGVSRKKHLTRYGLGVLFAGAVSFIPLVAEAIPEGAYWNVTGTASWSNTNNWTTAVPSGTTSVYVGYSTSGTAIVGAGVNGSFYIANVGARSGTAGGIQIDGGSLTGDYMYVGYKSAGTLVVNSGTLNFTGDGLLNIGENGTGTVTINGGEVNAKTVVVGSGTGSGGGTLILNGGTLSTKVLSNAFGTPTLLLNGGTIKAIGEKFDFLYGFDQQTFTVGTGGGTIDNNGYAIGIYGGIGGVGGVTFSGSGATTIATDLTYTGNTTVTSGTLILGDGDIQVAVTGNIVNNGTLVFKSFAGGSYVISGTGSVVKPSSDLVILTGNNTYTGLTTIQSGTLQIGNGGTSGSVTSDISIADTATLAFNRSDATTYAGSISGLGGVAINGSGTVIFTGDSTYSGDTYVNSGKLVLNGTLGDTTVRVAHGAIFGGNGYMDYSLVNSGLVSPGNSPGTLTLGGHYYQNSSGSLLIQIASATLYDRLVVSGNAYLGGNVQFEMLNGYRLQKGNQYTFLTSDDGIVGTFATTTNLPLRASLVYTGTSVYIDVTQGLFAETPGLTPNQLAVAKALDKVSFDSKVAGLVDKLDGYNDLSLPAQLEKLVPTNLIPMFDAIIAYDQTQTTNLENRLQDIRNGSTGFSSNGLSLSDPHGTRSVVGDGKQTIAPDGKALSPAPIDNRWGFFINGSGEWVDEESSSIARGEEFATSGITTGADYRLGDHAAFGLSTGYANTLGNGYTREPVRINSGKLEAYGTFYGNGAYLNATVGGGLNDYSTRRDTIGGVARGSTNGADFNATLGGGYTFKKGGLSSGPIASLRYSMVDVDGFTESGSLAPLKYESQSAQSFKSALGWQESYTFQVGKTVFTPQVRAQWLHEYLESARGIGASFLPGGSFTVFGPEVGRESLQLDVGANVQLNPAVGLYAFYTANLGAGNYQSQSVNGGVQVNF